jgi:hypothetical protein
METTLNHVEVVGGTPAQMQQFTAIMKLAGKEIKPVIVRLLDGKKIVGYEVTYPQPVSK